MKWVDYHLKQFKMAKSVRQKICFLRVWCLAESYECSVTKDMPYILKGGKHKKNMNSGNNYTGANLKGKINKSQKLNK